MPSVFRTAIERIDSKIRLINSSKIFAGLVVVVLNISSKYVNIGLSKSMESYLKHSFSRNIMVAAILWMGTRDIYTALLLTGLFVLFADFILNDDSSFCMIPEHIKQRHDKLANKPTDDEIKKAQDVLRRATIETNHTIQTEPNKVPLYV